MKIKPIVKWVLASLAALLILAITSFLLYAWLTHPKVSTDNIFIRPAGPGVFKMSDIPRGRALTPQEIDQYADKLLAEMTLTEKVHQMSGDTWLVGNDKTELPGPLEIQRHSDPGGPQSPSANPSCGFF